MANMIYTTYQTNCYQTIKSTFNTYELPHAPVIFSINFRIFKCFEIPTKPKISDKLCRFTEGGGAVAISATDLEISSTVAKANKTLGFLYCHFGSFYIRLARGNYKKIR